jgi:hypothetical protein
MRPGAAFRLAHGITSLGPLSTLPYCVTAVCSLLGIVKYEVEYKNKLRNPSSAPQCTVTVFAKDGSKVTSVKGFHGKIHIPKANFWWPHLTHPNPGYLYTLEVSSESIKQKHSVPVLDNRFVIVSM